MKNFRFPVVVIALSSALSLNAAAVRTQNSSPRIASVALAEIPMPNPHSPNRPTLTAEIPMPDPHSPNRPTLTAEIPMPNPHSPNRPTLTA
ncbi:MAG TPA: hypothetical protein VN633_17125 [Bryobacteraceae bacterium]|jgi:hypothetical protein|nr:hypothetical protein [Bryobacteraceae bacterium]